MKKQFTCREISPGIAEGEVLLCSEQILFYHTDPHTGVVTEHGHELEGVSVKDRLVVFPGGKGSSVVQMDGLYKLESNRAAPLGFLIREPDTVLVSTAIIMEIPMVDQIEETFYETIQNGDRIRVDTRHGMVEILQPMKNDTQ